jgi:hypothetical protein
MTHRHDLTRSDSARLARAACSLRQTEIRLRAAGRIDEAAAAGREADRLEQRALDLVGFRPLPALKALVAGLAMAAGLCLPSVASADQAAANDAAPCLEVSTAMGAVDACMASRMTANELLCSDLAELAWLWVDALDGLSDAAHEDAYGACMTALESQGAK